MKINIDGDIFKANIDTNDVDGKLSTSNSNEFDLAKILSKGLDMLHI
tara:strand:- start:233 stop:373 length:141 start_codon:yes stop_codon:yes gene_type:complete